MSKQTELMTSLGQGEFAGKPLTTMLYKGKPCWIAREIGEAIGYAGGGKRFATKITGDWSDETIEGHDYVVLHGKELYDFKGILEDGTDSVPSYSARLLLLFEPGMHLALIKTNKPAGKALRRFLVDKVLPQIARDGSYSPDDLSPMLRLHEERVRANVAPAGYFSVFGEGWSLALHVMRAGLEVGPGTIPDISIGLKWAEHWKQQGFDEKYGARIKYPHEYPESYPQSRARSLLAWVYPLAAMGVFRIWLQQEYMPGAFPKYIRDKVEQKAISAGQAKRLIEAFSVLPEPGKEIS